MPAAIGGTDYSTPDAEVTREFPLTSARYPSVVPEVGISGLIVILVVALLVFGPKRLPEIGRSVGKGMREFKDSIAGSNEPELSNERAALERSEEPAEAGPASQVEGRFCTSCGTEARADDRFCSNCGASLERPHEALTG